MKIIIIALTVISQLTPLTLFAKQISLTSYNAGLASGYVPLVEERKVKIIETLKGHASDILCLQEIYNPDVDDFIAALKDKYPYYYNIPPKQVFTQRSPACGISDLFGHEKFISCVISTCRSEKGSDFTKCVTTRCREPFERLKNDNNDCAAALIAQVGKGMVESILTVLNPFSKVPLYPYDGSSGLLLFSRYPIETKKFLEFKDSTSFYRTALYTKLDIDGGDYHIACTHLTPDLGHTAPYTGHRKGWSEENAVQTIELIEFMKNEANGEPQILLGDFNHGAADESTHLIGELADSYPIWSKNGYRDPAVEQRVGCSWCADNTLIEKEHDKKNTLIDHIFLKDTHAKDIKSSVIFNTLYDKTNLSDHFGLYLLLN